VPPELVVEEHRHRLNDLEVVAPAGLGVRAADDPHRPFGAGQGLSIRAEKAKLAGGGIDQPDLVEPPGVTAVGLHCRYVVHLFALQIDHERLAVAGAGRQRGNLNLPAVGTDSWQLVDDSVAVAQRLDELSAIVERVESLAVEDLAVLCFLGGQVLDSTISAEQRAAIPGRHRMWDRRQPPLVARLRVVHVGLAVVGELDGIVVILREVIGHSQVPVGAAVQEHPLADRKVLLVKGGDLAILHPRHIGEQHATLVVEELVAKAIRFDRIRPRQRAILGAGDITRAETMRPVGDRATRLDIGDRPRSDPWIIRVDLR